MNPGEAVEQVEAPNEADDVGTTDIIETIGALPSGALLTIGDLARIFKREGWTITRAVNRGELPPPVELLGHKRWTAGHLIKFIERRLDAEAEAIAIERGSRRPNKT